MAVQIDQNFRRMDTAMHGTMPAMWYGDRAVDGDAGDWDAAGPGSIYIKVDLDNKEVVQVYQKVKADSSDYDWVGLAGMGVVSQQFSYSDLTDGGSASGTLTLNQQIPAGAFVVRSIVIVETEADGTSTVMTIGDGTDADRYNTSTLDISSTGVVDGGAISGTAVTTAASDVVVTITENDDYGDVTQGIFTVKVFYHF